MERLCKKCGKELVASGFVFHEGEYYYCSEKCMFQDMTEQEYIDLYEAGAAYWTEFAEEQVDYFESAMIAAKFFAECYSFWKEKGVDNALELALADLSVIERSPYEPYGKLLNADAVKAIMKAAREAVTQPN